MRVLFLSFLGLQNRNVTALARIHPHAQSHGEVDCVRSPRAAKVQTSCASLETWEVCLDDGAPLYAMPCLCRGTVGSVHTPCLQRLATMRSDGLCPTCGTKLITVQPCEEALSCDEKTTTPCCHTVCPLLLCSVTLGVLIVCLYFITRFGSSRDQSESPPRQAYADRQLES